MRLLIALVCALPLFAHAQTPIYVSYDLAAAGLFSADQVSAARAGSFTPTDAPLAFHLNPALLAGVGRAGSVMVAGDVSLDYSFIPGTTHGGIAYGTNTRLGGAPLAVGVGLSRTLIDFGAVSRTSEELPDTGGGDVQEARETDWAAAVGAGWRGPVDVDLGVGLHRRWRTLDGGTGEGFTLDLGGAITLPILGRDARGPLSPALDVSVGYAQRHIGLGNEFDLRQAVPVKARAVRESVNTVRDGVLGYGARAGLDVALGSGHVRLIELDGRVEAVADLTDQALIGEIDLDDVLRGAGTASYCDTPGGGTARCGFGSVMGRRALRITLLDALSYTRGRASEGGLNTRSTWGVSLDAGATLFLIGLLTDNPSVTDVGERLTLRATYAEDEINGFEFSFAGAAVGWRL